jgi:hypothetical protein
MHVYEVDVRIQCLENDLERSKFRLGLQRFLYITLQYYYSKFLFPHLGDDSTLFDFLPFPLPQFEAVSSL